MSLLKTDRMIRRVSELDLAWLHERGIRGIVSDLDNTLAAWHGDEIPSDILEWLETVKAARIGVCLCSNTRRPLRLARIAETLGVHHVPGNAGKPGRAGVLHLPLLIRALQSKDERRGSGAGLNPSSSIFEPMKKCDFHGVHALDMGIPVCDSRSRLYPKAKSRSQTAGGQSFT